MFAAAALLAADLAATLDLSDRSEARLRSTQTTAAGSPPPTIGFDFFTEPNARLHANDRRWDLTLVYDLSFLAPDLEQGFSPLALQTGSAGVAWHDQRLRLTLTEDATYGLQNSAYLSTTAPISTPATGVPPTILATVPPTTLLYGSTRTAIAASDRVDRYTTLTLGAEYFIVGGLDTASQAVLPQQFGERALVTVDTRLSRSDLLTTAATAQHVDFSKTAACVGAPGEVVNTSILCQPSDELAQVVERLQHTLSRTETFTVGIGSAVSAIREQSNTSYHYAYYPVAEATYTDQPDRQGRLVLSARLAPYIDPRTGVVLNALIGDATFSDRLTHPVTLTVAAGASQNLPTGDPAAASILRAEVGVEYRFTPELAVAVGERAFWENENGLGNFVTTLGYVAVTVREPTLRF